MLKIGHLQTTIIMAESWYDDGLMNGESLARDLVYTWLD
jgi:hypothetical protein